MHMKQADGIVGFYNCSHNTLAYSECQRKRRKSLVDFGLKMSNDEVDECLAVVLQHINSCPFRLTLSQKETRAWSSFDRVTGHSII